LRLPLAHHFAIPEDHVGDTRHKKIARRYTHQVDDRTSTVIKTHREAVIEPEKVVRVADP
jgi:hypothetical protein